MIFMMYLSHLSLLYINPCLSELLLKLLFSSFICVWPFMVRPGGSAFLQDDQNTGRISDLTEEDRQRYQAYLESLKNNTKPDDVGLLDDTVQVCLLLMSQWFC